MQLPQYQRLGGPQTLFSISFGRFSVIIVSLPFFGFIFCVAYSVLFFFKQSTGTHCHVFNLLPSISAAIGNYQPQRFVWQLCIVLHFLPRLLIARMYLKHYEDIIRMNRRGFAYLAVFLNILENFALLGLSLFTSIDSYEIHKNCFVTFIAASEVYMLISYFLNKNGRKIPELNKIEEKSLKYKQRLFLINVVCFALAGYFFVRHNEYCEPMIYTFFAFFEYIVVFTNMGFHMTAYWDFSMLSLAFDWINGFHFIPTGS
ncbi:post-GPI attachment to proteins factor 2-like [Culicoides brevitarsis]|uniref:post-GPI attachment to proteins factor 2-like n=1 Tax=Culicoides brevitarsis TaxID=469753 RepID=UPI00307BDF82